MELMHPNRAKMVEIALEVLPFACEERFAALELGCGTGYFTRRFLERFPRARVMAVDGAASMVELAKARLGELVVRVDGILVRAAGRDPRFPDAASVRAFLDALEAGDADQPVTLEEDLRILRENGFPEAAAFWLEYHETVTGGAFSH